MAKFDPDIGWSKTKGMSLCGCGHHEKSHRPISRKCSLCDCAKFTPQKPSGKNAVNTT